MKRYLTAVLLVLVAACACAAQTARAGREVKFKVGQADTLEGGSLRVKFVRVESDSRCPVDVNCVWAGNAEIVFEVGGRGWRGRRTLTLNTNPSRERTGEGRYGRYTLKIVRLDPQPRSDRTARPGLYTATLLIVRE